MGQPNDAQEELRCERCGTQDPVHYYMGKDDTVLACHDCPDVHSFDAGVCVHCGYSTSGMDPEFTPFCPRRTN